MKASKELKALFQELVAITTEDVNNKDWAIQRWIGQEPFSRFTVEELMEPEQPSESAFPNETQHTQEPWIFDGPIIDTHGAHDITAGNKIIARVTAYEFYHCTVEEANANAARIVECVNALAGLTSEQVQQVAAWVKEQSATPMFDLAAKNRMLTQQRDELLKTLEYVAMKTTAFGMTKSEKLQQIEDLAKKSITNAKGDQQ